MNQSSNNLEPMNKKVLQISDGVDSQALSIRNSEELADYLSEGNSLSANPVVESTQADIKAYLALYARSQLKRIEKLTRYLDKLEDKLMDDIDSYEPHQFIKALAQLQGSLNSALDLLKMIGTDAEYLNIFYTENANFINNLEMGNKINIGLSKASREKLRTLIGKMRLPDAELVDASKSKEG